MLDFLAVSVNSPKKGVIEIAPDFLVEKCSDLMIRGGDFYAVWDESSNKWSTDEGVLIRLVDEELRAYAKKYDKFDGEVKIKYMKKASSGSIDLWHKYCQKQMRDNYHMLDENLIFSNMDTNKDSYASKSLPYPLEKGDYNSFDKLISTLYSPEERHKIEWCIGSIVTGDSKTLQKFMVFYGEAGSGKSTIINIIQMLFSGYYSAFNAKALGSSSDSFALEAFKSNPLVAIQHDGDLSRIEDNTRLNSLVSHELMTVNEKFKSAYDNRFKAFLIMGTNKPVKITDGRSGLIRRLIDVTPTGHKLPQKEYNQLMGNIKFELGAIAYHCKEVYLKDTEYYNNYVPVNMMGATNDFYNYVLDSYFKFKRDDGTTLKQAWEMYKTYCTEASVPYPLSQRIFREELKTYFWNYTDRLTLEDGTRVRSYYSGFKYSIFDDDPQNNEPTTADIYTIDFKEQQSIFDQVCMDYPAQPAATNDNPAKSWSKVTTTLQAIDTHGLHFVKVPINHIVIDFDIPGPDGKKNYEANLEAASKWPPTYAELSKSGAGIHLHYIYTGGDPEELNRVYDDHIEVKVFTGNMSLRRKLTKCNNLPIATINSGLPLKGVKKVINTDVVMNEKGIRTIIQKSLNKEHHGHTKPEIDFIYKVLEDAYNDGVKYDVSDMYTSVLAFATKSTHRSQECIKIVMRMHFKSEDPSIGLENYDKPIVFYDVEVFPNLFLVNWKFQGKDRKVVRMINPTPAQIEDLLKFRLVGFNCRRYDNHIMYARLMGYDNMALFKLSQSIIDQHKNSVMFGEAYNMSYTDVYDYCAKKQSLKKWEIELGIHHEELGLPWDKPVPKELWEKVAEYCDNDVIATEAVWDHTQADFIAREVLSDISGLSVNDTTNSQSTRIIFGKNKRPQSEFNYRDMGQVSNEDKLIDGFDDYTRFDKLGRPVFPGYDYSFGKSTYRGEEVGEGGYVYAVPGIYYNIALLDIASMHPSSIIAEQLFGKTYTKRFQDIRDARVAIKHKDYEAARTMLDGALSPYIDKIINGEITNKDLAQALKIVINSVYGLTSAKFENPFRDPRNADNIVAKRGALFMVNLKHEVLKRGFTVAHIKTDSIKIPDATPEIIQFVMDYGKMYGYNFEHEATYDRMCLVNDAVYIAKFATEERCMDLYGYAPGENIEEGGEWTATGTQFQVPYVFKKLFSKEPIEFEDMCEAKSATTSLYLDMNAGLPDVSIFETLANLRERIANNGWEQLRLTKKEKGILDMYSALSDENLAEEIARGHEYKFVGKVGNFCPVKEEVHGGLLLREKDGKYFSAGGAKGYRWLEAEQVRKLDDLSIIDRSYYERLVDGALEAIDKYGDAEQFINN